MNLNVKVNFYWAWLVSDNKHQALLGFLSDKEKGRGSAHCFTAFLLSPDLLGGIICTHCLQHPDTQWPTAPRIQTSPPLKLPCWLIHTQTSRFKTVASLRSLCPLRLSWAHGNICISLSLYLTIVSKSIFLYLSFLLGISFSKSEMFLLITISPISVKGPRT